MSLFSSNAKRIYLKFTSSIDEVEFRSHCKNNKYWYHSYYFDNGFVQKGDYDIGRDVSEYRFPANLEGMSVLDIGTGGGWFATYLEQLGADVTVTDARGYCDFDVYGRDQYPLVTTEKSKPDRILADGQPIYYSPVSHGFWIMKDILGLKANYVNARVYDICPELFGGKKFDLVFMGSVLMHLRDPIGALMAAHSVCRGQLIASTYLLPDSPSSKEPYMRMREGAADGISWWIPNRPCLIEWLKASGFSKFDIDQEVTLTSDSPYTDETTGKSTGVNQVQQLIHAFI